MTCDEGSGRTGLPVPVLPTHGPTSARGTTAIPSARRYARGPDVSTTAPPRRSPRRSRNHTRWRTSRSSTSAPSFTSKATTRPSGVETTTSISCVPLRVRRWPTSASTACAETRTRRGSRWPNRATGAGSPPPGSAIARPGPAAGQQPLGRRGDASAPGRVGPTRSGLMRPRIDDGSARITASSTGSSRLATERTRSRAVDVLPTPSGRHARWRPGPERARPVRHRRFFVGTPRTKSTIRTASTRPFAQVLFWHPHRSHVPFARRRPFDTHTGRGHADRVTREPK